MNAILKRWLGRWGLITTACVLLVPGRGLAGQVVLDGFDYSSTTAARLAWPVSSGAPGVTMATNGEWGSQVVMSLPCDFATRSSRCYWDRSVALALGGYSDFALEVYASEPGAFSSFTLYFRSGNNGWYGASASISQAGWQTLHFSMSDFIAEGTPLGWSNITGIRLSPWKNASLNTSLAVRELRAYTPTVLLIRDELSSNPSVVQDTIDRHLAWLGNYNISCGVLSSTGMVSGQLTGCRLAVLPYNENISDAAWTQLEAFVAAGGKLLVYYLLPTRMEPLLGMRRTGWAAGDFGAWAFSAPSIPGLPARVVQASWNITYVVPNGTLNSRVIAQWQTSQGVSTGRAAWLASDNGYFMSHVLLGDDAAQKSYALLCLVGNLLPEVWAPAVSGAIEHIGRLGSYLSYEEAAGAIRSNTLGTLREPLVLAQLDGAAAQRQAALTAQAATNYVQALAAAAAAQDALKAAYLQSLKPVTPEFRAIWEHHATGPYPGNWAAAIAALATNGFTAVFPNMLWGGLAHYASAWLPRSSEFTNYGDQISACVNAAHARGIQVHVWKVNWNLLGAPQTFIDSLRASNRTQVSSSGLPIDWLCPSHPDNLALETNSMLEVVRNYAIDGIHFDYIRYPDNDHCYCSGCQARFQAQSGLVVSNWPADVLASGTLRTTFLNWRRAQITRLVQAVHDGTKALKPQVKVSAAVFPDASSAYDEVGQDWRGWITAGLVDFLCPMDYTTSFYQFTNLVGQQLGYAAGRIPIYPGIGAFVLESDGVLAQLQNTRAAHTGGFILFEFSPQSAGGLFPDLRAGALAPDEPDTDNDGLPDSWEQRWFSSLSSAGASSDFDGDGLSDRAEYLAGTSPITPNAGLGVQLRAAQSNLELSFVARAVEGAGYQNAARHYRLESCSALAGPTNWQALAGYADSIASSGTQTVVAPVTALSGQSRFYRLKLWLQQK